MSNILSRKGLALGALVALTASFFSGTAAFAADEVTLVPSGTNTVTKTVEGEEFKLVAGLAPAVPVSNVVSLKYEVTTAFSDVVVTKTAQGTASTAAFTSVASASVGTSSVTVITPPSPTAGTAQAIFLKATSVAAATPKSATVIAFLDSTPNGTKDAGEWQSAPVTITWVDLTDVTANLTITAPLAGDSEVNGTVELVGINIQQVQSSIGGVFSNNNLGNVGVTSGATTGTGATSAATATTSASTGITKVSKGVASSAGSTKLLKGSLVKLQASFGGTAFGEALLVSAADRAITTITVGALVQAGVTTGAQAVADKNGATQGAIGVKTNNGFTVVASLGAANVPVTVAVSEGVAAALSATTSATINGVAYTSEAKLPGATGVDKLALTTDAAGLVKLVVTTTGLVSTDALTFTIVSQNFEAVTVATQYDSAYSIIEAEDRTAVAQRATAIGGTTAINYVVLDQFGVAPADSTYRLAVSATAGTQTIRSTGINQAYYPALVGGKATVSVVDNGKGAGKAEVKATLQKVGTDGNYSAVAGVTVNTITVNYLTVATAAKVTLDTLYSGTKWYGSAHIRVNSDADANSNTTDSADVPTVLKLSPKTFGNYDARLDKTATATAVDTTYAVNVTGTVSLSDVGQTVVPGAPVTVSAKGLQFTAGSGQTALDSITFYADASGLISFSVYSHTVGEQTITVASGTGSATLKLTFKADASSASAIAFSTATAAQAQSGRALDVSAVVTDKWGNVVESASVTFSSTGAGYISQNVFSTSAKGVVAAKLIAGSNDLGTAYITAALGTTTVSKSIELGETSVDAVAGGKRVFANVEFALGKTVTVTIDGVRKYSKVATTDNAMELAFTQKKKGKHTVTVRAGSVTTTEVVVTK